MKMQLGGTTNPDRLRHEPEQPDRLERHRPHRLERHAVRLAQRRLMARVLLLADAPKRFPRANPRWPHPHPFDGT